SIITSCSHYRTLHSLPTRRSSDLVHALPHELEVAPGLESAGPQALDFELPHVEKPVEPVGVAEEGGVAGEVEGEEPEREGGREDEGQGVPPPPRPGGRRGAAGRPHRRASRGRALTSSRRGARP